MKKKQRNKKRKGRKTKLRSSTPIQVDERSVMDQLEVPDDQRADLAREVWEGRSAREF